MKNLKRAARAGLMILVAMISCLPAHAISLWVGESYEWDFSGSVMGSTYNMNVRTSGGYLSVPGSGFYRTIKPTQYFSGSATVTAEWDYTLYHGGTMQHQRVSVTITCNENPVSISRTSVTLSPGETYQLAYRHAYDNEYVGAANAYFSGGNSSFSVTSGGLITAKSPGDGYVNVYSKVANASNAPACHVIVRELEPTGATTGNYSLYADRSTDLNVTVSPSNASVTSKEWYIKSGSDVVSISGSRLTGLKPGNAVVYCMVNGTVRSNDANVTVQEPALKAVKKTPTDGSDGISVFAAPAVTYSHNVSKGSEFGSIRLTGPTGGKIDGTVELSGDEVRFIPSKHLQPLTSYALSIPRNAVKNKWGSPAQDDVTLSFTTGDLETVKLEMSPAAGSYISSGETIKLIASLSDAKIYYTLDGSSPNLRSTLYVKPIEISSDATIKAFATRDGYKDSGIISGDFLKSQSEIVEYFPKDDSPMFNYSLVNPYMRLSGTVVKSNNFRRISLRKASGEDVGGGAYLANHIIVFVPDEPLENASTYTFDIPYDAIRTENGEIFKGFNWSFSTPDMPVRVGMQGDESVFVLSESGQLKTRGMRIKSSEPTGEIVYDDIDELTPDADGVAEISCGYFHRALLKQDATLAFQGLNYCGELGDSPGFSYTSGIRLAKAGFQTSAIICEDNTLWMSGRNDFYQLGDSLGTHSGTFVKVADNVVDVALGNGFTLFVDADNVLWGVGRNHAGQLGDGTTVDRRIPVRIMEGVDKVFTSASGYFSACITTGHELMTWGDNSLSQLGRPTGEGITTPQRIMSDVVDVALGEAHGLALTADFKLFSWGSNASGQIGEGTGTVDTPTLMAENVMAVDAGPHSSLILHISGKVTGRGRKTHANFGTGQGKASGFIIDDGRKCAELQGATLTPGRFEIKPQSEFAFSAVPQPLHADYEILEWSVDNPEVAQVDGNGIIRSNKLGETTVTAKFTDRHGNVKEARATVVCTDAPHNSGVESIVYGDNWSAYSNGGLIIVENAEIGATYSVYNMQGIMIGQSTASSTVLRFAAPGSGLYIVRSGNTAIKVPCR